MRSERRQQIEEVFQSALDHAPAQRAAYLDRACAGDLELRREVESFISSYEQAGSFLERPAIEVDAQLLAGRPANPLSGRSIGHSQIIEKSGAGGMGDVHLAPEDTKLGREVALKRSPHRLTLRFVLVGLFFVLMFIYAGANAYLSLAQLSTSSDPGWYVSQQGERVLIGSVRYDGPSPTLRVGDEIVALDGQRVKTTSQITQFFSRLKPGSHYTIVIQRDGQLQELMLETAPFPLSYLASVFVESLLVPASFLLTGLAVFLLKPHDKQALLFALLFGMGIPYNFFYSYVGLPWCLVSVLTAGSIVATFPPPVLLHFFLLFPEPSPLLRRFPRLKFYLYLPHLLIILPVLVTYIILRAIAPERVSAFQVSPLLTIASALAMMHVAGGLLLLLVNYRQASPLSRRKLRVVLAGCFVGALPWWLWYGALLLSFSSRINQSLWWWLEVAAHAAFLLTPLAFAYAIVRHQVIPVSLIVRGGVQYLLAKNALRTVVALPIIGLALTILSDPNRTLTEIVFNNSIYFYLLIIVSAALGLMYRRRFSEWIDRKFFREAYNQEKILRELIDDVKKLDSMPEISKLVSQKVERALHPESIYLFYREEEKRDLSLGYRSGENSRELRIPEASCLVRFMEDQTGTRDFPFPQKNNLPPSETAWLAALDTELIVPMRGGDERLAGLFLLGEKRSQVPYTARDRELLEALADQIAIVYENARLRERVNRDRKIKREVLARFEGRQINLLKECPTCGACFDSPVQTCAKDGSELRLSLPVERTVEERYRLDRLIGKGGMGAVYEATDLRLNRQVAVKILVGSMLRGDSAALRRFEREAQTSARLNHPHIIDVHDYGRLDAEGAYLVMELVHGRTLSSVIKGSAPIHPCTAAEWFDQVLEGVKAAHERGVIHRDLKPGNIMLSKQEGGRDLIKILDFGLAKFTLPDTSDANSLTTPGMVMGTFGYMSPEQLTGGEVDARSDLFSVGVMVVETLTGRRPFSGETYAELLHAVLQKPFHLRSKSEEVRRLDVVLQKCLAKSRMERFTSAAEMQKELLSAMRRCPLLASPETMPAK